MQEKLLLKHLGIVFSLSEEGFRLCARYIGCY